MSREDLILSKLLWSKDTGSEQQRCDIINLLGGAVDHEYLEHWSVAWRGGSLQGAAAVNDTSDQVARLIAERYRQMSGVERIRIAAGMFDTARALILASEPVADFESRRGLLLRRLYPELTASDVFRARRLPKAS